MSTSSAPSSTARRASATLRSVGYWPEGKPVATEATRTPVPRSRSARGTLPASASSGLRAGSVTGFALVPILRVAPQEIGERHPQRTVLHLPDVAELVGQQRVVGEVRPRAEQDRPVRPVAVEAAE